MADQEPASLPQGSSGPSAAQGAPVPRTVPARSVAEALSVWQHVAATSVSALALADLQGNVTYVNAAVLKLAGYEDEREIVGRPWPDFAMDRTQAVRVLDQARATGRWEGDITCKRKDGSPVETRLAASVVPDEAGNPLCLMASFTDITEIERAQAHMEKMLGREQVVREVNHVLLRAVNLSDAFRTICQSLLRVEGVRLAWIGLTQKGTFEVKPVAVAGAEEGYLAFIRVTWDDTERGKGPTGMAIKTGKPVAMRDIAGDPQYAPWRKQALQGGYASSIAVPLKDEAETVGALNVCSSRKDAFGDEETRFLTEVAGDIAVAVRTWRLEGRLRQAAQRIQRVFRKTIEAIARLAETRDPYTAGHQRRVADLACAIAKAMGFSDDRLTGLRMAATIHDIGKLHVPAEILVKPGRLGDTEFRLIKCHPQVAYDTLKGLEFPWPVAEIIHQHHERLDGSGYPQGLTGDKMSLEAKILAVADVVEAMSSHRPYRPALGIEKALATLSVEKAIRYDGDVVDMCVRLFETGAFQFKDEEEEETSASQEGR